MKKNILVKCLVISLIVFNNSLAVDFLGTNDYKILKLKKRGSSTEIYIPNYKNQEFLLYKSNFVYGNDDVISVSRDDDSDIVFVHFECGKTSNLQLCSRFFNRRTSQMSAIISEIIATNNQENVVAYQVKSKDLIVVTPIFQKCANPLTYKVKIYPDTDFGIKSKFLKNGDLQLDYVDFNNKLVLKAIPINYKKLYQRCGLKEPLTANS